MSFVEFFCVLVLNREGVRFQNVYTSQFLPSNVHSQMNGETEV